MNFPDSGVVVGKTICHSPLHEGGVMTGAGTETNIFGDTIPSLALGLGEGRKISTTKNSTPLTLAYGGRNVRVEEFR